MRFHSSDTYSEPFGDGFIRLAFCHRGQNFYFPRGQRLGHDFFRLDRGKNGKQDANSHLFIAIRSIGFFVQTTLFSDEKFVDPPRQSLPGSNVIVKPVVDRLCRNERGNYHCRDSRSVLSEPKLVSVRSSECGPVAGLDCPGETT
jgi:hypothetical protein